jgi:hypothetical protein
VPSEFQERAGSRAGFDSAILNVSAADVTQQAYRSLMANSVWCCRPRYQDGAADASAVSAGGSSSQPSAASGCASVDPHQHPGPWLVISDTLRRN